MKSKVWKIVGVLLIIAMFGCGCFLDIKARGSLLDTASVEDSASEASSEVIEEAVVEATVEATTEESVVEASVEASSEEEPEKEFSSESENFPREMLFSDHKTENEELLDKFINNEVTAVDNKYGDGEPFYFSDIPHDPEDFLSNYYIEGRADLDNDGENELLMGGPYGGMYIDACDGQVFVMAKGEGTALSLEYCYYEDKAYILQEDTSHQGRLVYNFDAYDNKGNVTESFILEAQSETDTYDDKNATFSFKGETIDAAKFNEIRDEISKKDLEIIGEYIDTEFGDPNLCIARNGKDYIVQFGIYRLTTIHDGYGVLTDKGIEFTATDAAGNPIAGIITFENKVATITFTDSTWSGIENGDSYEYTYQSYIPQLLKVSSMFKSYSVELTEVGPNKVKVIKAVREVTGLGLKEAKDLVDEAPSEIASTNSSSEANEIKEKLEAEGATVTIK